MQDGTRTPPSYVVFPNGELHTKTFGEDLQSGRKICGLRCWVEDLSIFFGKEKHTPYDNGKSQFLRG